MKKKRLPVSLPENIHSGIKEYCDNHGLKIQSFFNDFDVVMVQNYIKLVELRKKGKILELNEDLLIVFSCINEFIQFNQLDCLLYEQFEEKTKLTQSVGKANFKVLLELAKLGLETEAGQAIIRINEVNKDE